MKAVVLHEYGDADQLKYESVPDPVPGYGEILVEVAAIGVNAIDWKLRSGAAKERMPLDLPAILGRDIAGTVCAVGAHETRFRPGDRVLGLVNHGYAEFVASKVGDFAIMPDGMSFETAASLPLVILTGQQLAIHAGKVHKGQSILITGALGGVGRCAVHAALKAGARVVAGVRASERDEAKHLGVADVVALDDEADVKRLGPYDVVADTLGRDIAKMLIGLVRSGGIFASVLGMPEGAEAHPDIHFAPMMAHSDSDTLEIMAYEVGLGQFEIPVGRTFPLSEAAEAQKVAENGGVGKVLLIP
jgi:NADPH:quinone reductase-like Zn-dependent oxidoreductase